VLHLSKRSNGAELGFLFLSTTEMFFFSPFYIVERAFVHRVHPPLTSDNPLTNILPLNFFRTRPLLILLPDDVLHNVIRVVYDDVI